MDRKILDFEYHPGTDSVTVHYGSHSLTIALGEYPYKILSERSETDHMRMILLAVAEHHQDIGRRQAEKRIRSAMGIE